MEQAKIGIIGGSGLYQMDGLTDIQEVSLDTPFGRLGNALALVDDPVDIIRDERPQRQMGRCAICDKATPDLHVDHDHISGRIRALLCGNCNRMIGIAGESPQRLRSAASYLEQYVCRVDPPE